MIKLPKVTPQKYVSINQAARNATENMSKVSLNSTPDMVDLSKFNAETNKIGFFKKLVKTIKVLWRANTRLD